MKPTFQNGLGWVVVLIATAAFHVSAFAESIESQCRSAVRAEMLGPSCRMPNPTSISYEPGNPCYLLGDTKLALYTDKVIQCIAHRSPPKR